METFEARLKSFRKSKGKSSSKSSAALAWPHPDTFGANPTSLAEAGFFFKPSKDDPDNVQCFMCKKELGGWVKADNPFEVHWDKCPKCHWAIVRCALEFDVDKQGRFILRDDSRLPTCKAMEKARLETFGKKWWPHDSVRKHGATSKKMAKAGFAYTPQVPGDDTATCFYCDLCLSGWDAEDDPTEEHIKRVERSGKACPFFQVEARPKSQSSTRSNKSNSRKSRALKSMEITSDEDEVITAKPSAKRGKGKHDDADKELSAEDTEDLQESDDPSLKVQPTQSTRKSSKNPASKAKPASKTSTKSKQHNATPSEEADDTADEINTKPPRNRTKSGRGGKNVQEKQPVEEREKQIDKPPSNVDGKIMKAYRDFTVDINAAEEAKEKAKKGNATRGQGASRSRSRSKSKARSTDETLVDRQSQPLLRAPPRSRISGMTEMEEMETERMLAETPSESEVEPEPPKSKRRQTRSKKPQEPSSDEDVDVITARPISKSSGVATEKSTGKAKNRTAEKKSKAASKPSSKATATPEQKGTPDSDIHTQTADEDLENSGFENQMDVDVANGQGRIREDDHTFKEASNSSPRSLYPTPASPSDFKDAPAKSSTEEKLISKLSTKPEGRSQTPATLPKASFAKEKLPSSKAKHQRSNSNKGQLDAIRGARHVDETRHKSRSPDDQATVVESHSQPTDTEDATSESLPQPVTPEKQIMRQAPQGNFDISSDFGPKLQVPPSPANLFLPPLANRPIQMVTALTEEERSMTVEQWIRHEMAVQYQRLKEDGESRIRAFLEKAEETRRRIEAL